MLDFLKNLFGSSNKNSDSNIDSLANELFPGLDQLKQQMAEIGEGPLLPTLAGIPSKRESMELIKSGQPNKFHKCKFKPAEWPTELGADVTDIDSMYGTYKFLSACSCGAQKIYSKRAWI